MESYLTNRTSNPDENRMPWFRLMAPCYAGIFLWVGFDQVLAQGTIDKAGFGVLLFGLIVAGLLAFALFYYVPAKLGCETGYSLGIIGSSTFGSKGGWIATGIFTCALQIAWFGAATFFGARLMLISLGRDAQPGTPLFGIVAIVWGFALALVALNGIRLVADIAFILNLFTIVTMLVIVIASADGWQFHSIENPQPLPAFALIIQMVMAFFATAGLAAAGFGRCSRSVKDIFLGGITGIFIPVIFAGTLALFTITCARALDPGIRGYGYIAAVAGLNDVLPGWITLLLAVSCIPASVFFAFAASDSFTVMLPAVRRSHSMMIAASVGAVIALTGLPGDFTVFITILGALSAPICGAVTADYVRSGMKWPHIRPGINYAGYISWALGFLVGIVPVIAESQELRIAAQPAALYSYITGFIFYILLVNVGLKPYRKRVKKWKKADSESKGKTLSPGHLE